MVLIGGSAGNIKIDVNGQALTLVYVDDTEGWINVQNRRHRAGKIIYNFGVEQF